MDFLQDVAGFESGDSADDLLPVSQEPSAFDFFVVFLCSITEFSGEIFDWYQLVLDHINVRAEVSDCLEQAIVKRANSKAASFNRQECRKLVLVQDVVCLELRSMNLKQAEAVGMDGSDEAVVHLIEEGGAKAVGHPLLNAALQLFRCGFVEGERHDLLGLDAAREEVSYALRDNLCFPGARRGDDLQVTIAMFHRIAGRASQDWGLRHSQPLASHLV